MPKRMRWGGDTQEGDEAKAILRGTDDDGEEAEGGRVGGGGVQDGTGTGDGLGSRPKDTDGRRA